MRRTQRCGWHHPAKHRQRAAPATAGELSHHHLWVCHPRPPVALGPSLGLSVPVCIRAAARSERAGVRGAAGRAVATDPAFTAATPRARQGDLMHPLHQPHALVTPTPHARRGDPMRQPRASTAPTTCALHADPTHPPRPPSVPTSLTPRTCRAPAAPTLCADSARRPRRPRASTALIVCARRAGRPPRGGCPSPRDPPRARPERTERQALREGQSTQAVGEGKSVNTDFSSGSYSGTFCHPGDTWPRLRTPVAVTAPVGAPASGRGGGASHQTCYSRRLPSSNVTRV